MSKKLLIVDGNLHLHKSHAIHGKLSTKVGDKVVKTGVIYGFLRTLVRTTTMYNPVHTVIVFDRSVCPADKSKITKRKKIADDVAPRYEAYATYKIGRKALPLEIWEGKKILDRFLRNMNVTLIYSSILYEADDLIAYVTHRFELYCLNNHIDGEVVIHSEDKDFNQLLQKNRDFSVRKHCRGDKVYGWEDCVKGFGVVPPRFTLFQALNGDSNDGIPGVPGYGPKKSAKLVEESDGDNLRIAEALADQEERRIFYRNLGLVTLSCDRAVVGSLQHYKLDIDKLNELFRKYKMASFLRADDQESIRKMRAFRILKSR